MHMAPRSWDANFQRVDEERRTTGYASTQRSVNSRHRYYQALTLVRMVGLETVHHGRDRLRRRQGARAARCQKENEKKGKNEEREEKEVKCGSPSPPWERGGGKRRGQDERSMKKMVK